MYSYNIYLKSKIILVNTLKRLQKPNTNITQNIAIRRNLIVVIKINSISISKAFKYSKKRAEK